jgi:hypothetical protein
MLITSSRPLRNELISVLRSGATAVQKEKELDSAMNLNISDFKAFLQTSLQRKQS